MPDGLDFSALHPAPPLDFSSLEAKPLDFSALEGTPYYHTDAFGNLSAPGVSIDNQGNVIGANAVPKGAGPAPVRAAEQLPTQIGGGLVHAVGTIGEAAGTAVKNAPEGAKQTVQNYLDIMDSIDAGQPAPKTNTPPGGIDFQGQFAQTYAAANPDQRAAMRKSIEGAQAGMPETEQEFANAGATVHGVGEKVAGVGTAIEQAGENAFPLTDEEKQRFSVKAVNMIGNLMTYVGAGAIAGLPGVIGLAGVQGFGDTYDAAKQNGADDERAAAAGLFGGLANAGLMTVPVGRALDVMDKLPGALHGEFMKAVTEAAKSGATLTAFSQLNTLSDNVIARSTYDPGRSLTQGIGENLPETFVAGAVAPVIGAAAVAAVGRARPEPTPVQTGERVMQTGSVDDAINAAREVVSEPVPSEPYDIEKMAAEAAQPAETTEGLDRFGGLNTGTIEQDETGGYRFRAATGEAIPLIPWEPQHGPVGDEKVISPQLAAAQQQHYEALGIRVVYFQNDPTIPFDGAVDPNQPDTIFLSNNPTRNAAQVGAHEVTHVLESTTLPDGQNLGDLLHQQIKQGITDEGWRYANELFGGTAPDRTAFPEGPEGDSLHADAVANHLITELGADIGGEAPRFDTFAGRVVDAVQQRFGPKVAQDILGRFIAGIRTAMDTMRGFFASNDDPEAATVSQNWVTNLDDVHNTLAQMYAAKYGTQLEKEQAVVEGMRRQAQKPPDLDFGALHPTATLTPPPTPEAREDRLAAPSGLEALDPRAVKVDAARFQFKAGGDRAGVTDRLQGVQHWDPRLAGVSLVWRDLDGQDWVADGHQRFGLATRLMNEGHGPIRVNAFVLNAGDGVSDADARVIAAAKNIAEGTGTPIDAAKVMREAGAGNVPMPPLPPRSQLVRDGRALATLAPEAFGMAVNEVVPVNQAAIVGRLVTRPADQVEAMRVLAKAKPENARQAEMIVRDMLASGTEQGVQTGLFGDEAFASSVVLERAKVMDEAQRQLARDKTVFNALVTEADRIQSQGTNALDETANQARLSNDERASQFLATLATRKGPVSDALTAIARRLKSGEVSRAAAAKEFLDRVRGEASQGLAEGPTAGGAVAGAEGEVTPALFSPKLPGEEEDKRRLEAAGQTILPGAEHETAEQLAARQRQRDKEIAEAQMRGAKTTVRPQQPIRQTAGFGDQTDLFGGASKKPTQGTLFSPRQVETPEFKRWFGASKMVGRDGKPTVFYHGTDADIDSFENKGPFGNRGFYFTKDSGYANFYAFGDGAKKIYPVYLRIENPKVIDNPLLEKIKAYFTGTKSDRTNYARSEEAHSSMALMDGDIAKLKAQGYDGIVNKLYNEVVVFDPEQIKSAVGNRGTFDQTNTDIRFSPRDRRFTGGGDVDQASPEDIVYRDEVSRLIGAATGETTGNAGEPTITERTLAKIAVAGAKQIKNLNPIETETIFPRTLASLDSMSAPFWNAWESRDQRGIENAETLKSIVDKSLVSLPAESRDRVYAALELARKWDWRPPDDGRPVRVKNTSYWQAQKSKPGDDFVLTPEETQAFHDTMKLGDEGWRMFMRALAQREGWNGPLDPDAIRAEANGDRRLTRLADALATAQQALNRPYFPAARFGDYFIAVKPKAGVDEESLGGYPEVKWFETAEKEPLMDLLGRQRKGAGDVKAVQDAVKRLREMTKPDGSLAFPEDQYDIETGDLRARPDVLRKLNIPAIEKLFMLLDRKVTKSLADNILANEEIPDGTPADIRAEAKARYQALFGETKEALLDAVYHDLLAGWKKAAALTPGYSADFDRAIGNHIYQVGRNAADMQYRPQIDGAYENIQDNHPHQTVKDYWRHWREYQENPRSPAGRAAANIAHVGATYVMGLNPATTLIVGAHTPMMAAPILGVGGGIEQAVLQLTRSLRESYASLKFDKKGAGISLSGLGRTPAEKAMLAELDKAGLLHSVGANDVRSINDRQAGLWGKAAPVVSRGMDIATSNIAAVDQANRISIALATYRMAQNPERVAKMMAPWMEHSAVFREMAIERGGVTPEMFTRFMLSEAAGSWGKMNQAPIMRGAEGSLIFALHGFQTRYLSTAFKLAKNMGPEGRVAAAWMMGALWAATGIYGLPFFQDLETAADKLIQTVTGENPMIDAHLRSFLNDAGLGKIGTEILLRGPLSVLFGTDLSSRIGFGDIVSRDLSSSDLVGTVPSILFGRLAAAWNRLQSGQGSTAAAVEFLPNALRAPARAYIDSQQGILSRGGRMEQTAGNLTRGDIAMQSLGFTPLKQEQAFARNEYLSQLQGRDLELHQRIVSTVANLVTEAQEASERGDGQRAAALTVQVETTIGVYNKAHFQTPVTGEEIGDALLQRKNPELYKRMKLLELLQPEAQTSPYP